MYLKGEAISKCFYVGFRLIFRRIEWNCGNAVHGRQACWSFIRTKRDRSRFWNAAFPDGKDMVDQNTRRPFPLADRGMRADIHADVVARVDERFREPIGNGNAVVKDYK